MSDPPLRRVMLLSNSQKIAEVFDRAARELPTESGDALLRMVEPRALEIMVGTLTVWVGSHAFGVGEFVDLLLLGVGGVVLGLSVFEGAEEFYEFASTVLEAQSEYDLDQSAHHLARAVVVLGLSTIQALLFKSQARGLYNKGMPKFVPRPRVALPPAAGDALRVTRPPLIPGGALGSTDPYGAITIMRNQPATGQRLALLHELVHRYLSPRTGPLLRLRAQAAITGYKRIAFLRYLEEVLAQGYAQLRVNGLAEALRTYRFPIDGGYVTVSQMMTGPHAIGTIILGGAAYHVSVDQGPMPRTP